jgi:hypothetical protein
MPPEQSLLSRGCVVHKAKGRVAWLRPAARDGSRICLAHDAERDEATGTHEDAPEQRPRRGALPTISAVLAVVITTSAPAQMM